MLASLKMEYQTKLAAKSTLAKKVQDFNNSISYETAMIEHQADIKTLEKLSSECKTLENKIKEICRAVQGLYGFNKE
jgi:hypothetical protein